MDVGTPDDKFSIGFIPGSQNRYAGVMETTARDLARIERRLREARGYSEGYGKLLHHSARKVLAESGYQLPDEQRPIPIDADAVEAQITRFTDRPPSERRPRSSTAANYAENWRRFARWSREYLRAEAAGEEDLYLHKLGRRAPKRSQRSLAERVLSEDAPRRFSLASIESPSEDDLLDEFALEPMRMMAMPPALPAAESFFAYPSSRRAESPDDLHVITVRTSFGPYRMELPRPLAAEDAARIARAVLRLVD